jgi:ATP synthase protein I
MNGGGTRRVAERGGQPDKDQRELAERRGDERREDESRERENEALRARLDKLSGALAAQQRDARKLGQYGPSPASMGNAMGLAFRVLSEFVAAVIVGGFIGWWIDRLAGTSPAFLIILLLMGAAAGFWNVYRIAIKPPGLAGR